MRYLLVLCLASTLAHASDEWVATLNRMEPELRQKGYAGFRPDHRISFEDAHQSAIADVLAVLRRHPGPIHNAEAYINTAYYSKLHQAFRDQRAQYNPGPRSGQGNLHRQRSVFTFDPRDGAPAVVDVLAAGELVEHSLAILTDGERELLRLRFVEGLSEEETAARLGIGQKAVSSRTFRARKRLREKCESKLLVWE